MNAIAANDWDQRAKEYSKLASSREIDAVEYLVNFPSILKLCRVGAKKVLDVGCGDGSFTVLLNETFPGIEACDSSPEFLKLAKEKLPNTRFYLQNLEEKFLALPHKFDLLVCKLVLMFVEDLHNFADESFKILNPGGYLVFSVIHPFHWTRYYLEDKFKFKPRPKFAKMKKGYFSEIPISKSIADNPNLTFDYIHRTFSTYINTFTEVGFVVDKIYEPQLTKELLAKRPGDIIDTPMRLNVRLLKSS